MGGRPSAWRCRSAHTGVDALVGARPDVVVLAFCGYDAATTKGIEASLRDREYWQPVYDPGVPVVCADGSAHFSRPGPRVVDGVEQLAATLRALA